MIPSGWWIDRGETAHFLEDEEEDAFFPLCAPEGAGKMQMADWNWWARHPRAFDKPEPRVCTDMGNAHGKPCPECLRRLEGRAR